MLEVNAENYVKIGEIFRDMDRLFDGGLLAGLLPVSDEGMRWLRVTMPQLGLHCESLDLPVTLNLIRDLYAVYRDTNPKWSQAIAQLNCIREAFKAELRSRQFMHVRQFRMVYYSNTEVCGKRIAEFFSVFTAYPSVRFEITSAGNCLCYECFTAAVYHLMRTAEYGLVSLVHSIGEIPKNPSWDNLLGAIHRKVNTLSSVDPKPADWKQQEQFYCEASALFKDIKNAWRNPVSHIPRTYQETQVEGIFVSVRNVMNHLLHKGITELRAMPESIAMPEMP